MNVMRSQEELILHVVFAAPSREVEGHALTDCVQILHHIEEETVKGLLVPHYSPNEIIELDGISRIGDMHLTRVLAGHARYE